MTTILTVAAICFRNDQNELLTVRKRGTRAFMLPGGKLDPGESPAAAAIREIHEELGLVIMLENLKLLGHWTADAANESDTVIESTVFVADLPGEPAAAAEIAELWWLPLQVDDAGEFIEPDLGEHNEHGPVKLAPMLRRNAIPALLAQQTPSSEALG